MRKFLFLIIPFLISSCDFSDYIMENDYDFTTVFEKSGGTETATYPQVIDFYQNLAGVYPSISLQEMGETDSGKPLHLAVFNPDGEFDIENLRKDHNILFIVNGIHPGESDGIDATMMLFRDLAQDSIPVPENTIIATIPVYNVGGALNRNSSTRTNQNGPKSYGFRGNARNFDLNRDFIKADTKNTRSFYEIFHYLKPDVLIDTHVSNGADYQYVLSHLFTQHNKLGGELGEFLNEKITPALEKDLMEKDLPITPYVNVFGDVPEKGFNQFLDTPRYSTGYAALWNTLGMMVETHMLKPYDQRVMATYELLRSMISITEENAAQIEKLRAAAFEDFREKEYYSFGYEADSSDFRVLDFKGYEADTLESVVTGLPRLKYDRSKPFTKEVNYYNQFRPTGKVSVPSGYIIPQAWYRVINLLELNEVEMKQFEKDTTMKVEVYHIADFETRNRAYEGHYPHYNTRVTKSIETVEIGEGDYYVSTDQRAGRYLMAVLEPEAPDSYFNWNFFDSILQQKEHFSSYVFEEEAEEILEDYPEIDKEFQRKRQTDPEFAGNAYAQLNWIYKQSDHYEEAHLRYPIFRLVR
ncbi:MAG TPA: M14 family metallopeptidase [Salinimicrobium sp.]|nr:M14 family metallopeptidase [Salinimicrobium sp.]